MEKSILASRTIKLIRFCLSNVKLEKLRVRSVCLALLNARLNATRNQFHLDKFFLHEGVITSKYSTLVGSACLARLISQIENSFHQAGSSHFQWKFFSLIIVVEYGHMKQVPSLACFWLINQLDKISLSL